MNSVLLILLSLVMYACGLQDVVKSAATEDYKYSFTENFCQTGDHSFSSNAAMCTGLQSNSLNNACAQAARQNYFYANCAGSFGAN